MFSLKLVDGENEDNGNIVDDNGDDDTNYVTLQVSTWPSSTKFATRSVKAVQ